MNQILSPSKRVNDFNLELFRIRLPARLCIIIVCLLVFIPRVSKIISDPSVVGTAELLTVIALPFPFLMSLVIVLEYLLYKKLGANIIKYSFYVDLVLLLFFLTDWILILIANLNKMQSHDPPCFQVAAVFGFTSFSWRTLMVTIIVQKWQLKIIAPVAALSVATGYVLYYTSGNVGNVLLSAGTQLFDVVIIIYCEDKVKWKMVWANIQKDKWMQVNNFILNSIPENIILLDLNGEPRFISEYCKSFITKCPLPVDTKDFFKRIASLQKQYEPDPQSPSASLINVDRLTTVNGLLGGTDHNDNTIILEDLIVNFKNLIIHKEIQERQFLIYNGKLQVENHSEKSLEIKISFVQHFHDCFIILILRDTTQRDLLITLEETNKYKDQLLASVSHELRAPLNGTINMVDSAVQSKYIPDQIKEGLLIPALRSSRFLLHIINDILDMSQIKEKKLRLVFQSENLKETLKNTAQLVELQAKKKGIELKFELDPNLPKFFSTDHVRLSQIVLNLMNNAIKFTQEGAIKLTAQTIPEEPNWIKIRVEDSGIGMNQENVQKLFSSYTHIEFEGRQIMNPTGVGLGLNIAYNLALLLGPKDRQGITVTSVPGQGSVFTFILENKEKSPISIHELQDPKSDSDEVADEFPEPIHHILASHLQQSSIGWPSLLEKLDSDHPLINITSCSCAKIMVVDDNPFNTMAFETILGSLEVKCDCVFSGSACIKSLLSRESKVCGDNCKQYAMIFMDQEMPEMSGTETVDEIIKLQKQNLLSQGIKIIGCTAHKSKEEVDKFIEAGIELCIHKPISVAMIKDVLRGIV